MLPGSRELVASGSNEAQAPPDQSGTLPDPSMREVSNKQQGKWGTCAVVVPTDRVNQPSLQRHTVEMKTELWGELHKYIDLEMVAAQLPLHAFFRARGVCKSWNSLPSNRPYLEQHSTTSLPEPYFIIHGKPRHGCHQAILVKDQLLEKWVLKPLPAFAFAHQFVSLADGLVFGCSYAYDTVRGQGYVVRSTIFNLHTKVFRWLPSFTTGLLFDGVLVCTEIVVDKHSGSYKVFVAGNNGCLVWVFESITGEWTQKTGSPAPFYYVENTTHCDGVVYIKCRGRIEGIISHEDDILTDWVFAYNLRDDVWTVLPMVPPANPRMNQRGWFTTFVQGLGEWRGSLRDVTLDVTQRALHVMEFDRSMQGWREVDRMPGDMYAWILAKQGAATTLYTELPQFILMRPIIRTYYFGHYMLVSHIAFAPATGLVRLVLYDMASRTWETLHVDKDWRCLF